MTKDQLQLGCDVEYSIPESNCGGYHPARTFRGTITFFGKTKEGIEYVHINCFDGSAISLSCDHVEKLKFLQTE